MIAVVDYCKGNLKSVERGLRAVGADAHITDNPAVIASADAIVLPGVGAFADAVETMNTTGQMEVIRKAIAQGKPFLGICLGLHLMFEEGTEGADEAGTVQGLGVLEGCCTKLPSTDEQGKAYKIPHVGWNSVEYNPKTAGPLFAHIIQGEFFYFTHSYQGPCTNATVATTTHSAVIPAAVRFGQCAYGVQFHPEKSSDAGLQILRNFCELACQI